MIKIKKVCIVTASRSEYGLLRWLIDEVKNDHQLCLQLVVTGTHLSPEFGLTYTEIEKDGYEINEKVDMQVSSSNLSGIVKSLGFCSIGFSDVFSRLNSDLVIVLGDRYELLSICGAALLMKIPIAHISGGDITEGAIDDQIRNAVTMMATLHFPGVENSAKRIERMRGASKGIHPVGEPGLDNLIRLTLWNRENLAENIGLDLSTRWILLTYHPETKLDLNQNIESINNIINVLDKTPNSQIIITGANSDFGGFEINKILKKAANSNETKYKFFNSLGQHRYLSLMKEVDLIIGNSSSGIVEAPFLAKSVVNVGKRQKGRYISTNITSCSNEISSIFNAVETASSQCLSPDSYFGDGKSSSKIKKIIKEFLFK
tara:strand:- start:6347 stop:7468 length:1122 start_codon:yes stop_codon:yes gene_type:complete